MRNDLFDEFLENVTEAKAITQGRTAPSRAFQADEILHRQHPDVTAEREHLTRSQSKFAALLGISVDTLKNWE